MTVLKANEGKIFTDGESYGKVIFLAEGADPSKFHEITDAEYAEILAAEAAKMEEKQW